MKKEFIRQVVESTIKKIPPEKIIELRNRIKGAIPPDLVDNDRMNLRRVRLAEADIQPSPAALERILGTNDLVDINYLVKGINTSRAVCRLILRDNAGREIGYGTGFKVSPHLLLTNHHVLTDERMAGLALAEFNYELDLMGNPKLVTRFALEPQSYFFSNVELDFSLVCISERPLYGAGSLVDFGFIRIFRVEGKINKGEFVSIIQHPSGQPKQAAIRENDLLDIGERVLLYHSDTAQGSSGSPVFNDSWQLVGLHHSGVPKTDDQGNWLLKNGNIAGADADDGDIDWLANEGIRASRIIQYLEANSPNSPFIEEFFRVSSGEIPVPVTNIHPEAASSAFSQPVVNQPQVIQNPNGQLTVTITVGNPQQQPCATPQAPAGGSVAGTFEKLRIPDVDTDYDNRKGYLTGYLGTDVPLPGIKKQGDLAKLDDGSIFIPYEHFSVVMHKKRRLALLCASNVDASPLKKRPEPNKDYTRKGLGGFGDNDTEKWLTDPRIPQNQQLPDLFYTKDGGAFDKGHIVRREDVCWGDTYKEVKRANGDTYHVTNCSPQVKDFNRSNLRGVWGKLENYILRQAGAERYCLFAGPVLRNHDRLFHGKDQAGPVTIRIPSAFWKIVVANSGNGLLAFAFILEQDLQNVPLEFAVNAEWKDYMISIKKLQTMLKVIEFPDVVLQADQFAKPAGESLRKAQEFGYEILEYEGEEG
ncbi:MAG: DNA/RNA non-specific endonuclease [Bacteroidales bacterium]|nr:DNA/RNA non-specific endonuclease [Bacteroidales bacterium]